MKKLILAGLLIALSSVAVFADTFTLKNGTGSYTFYELYISYNHSDDWGPEQLGDGVMGPGQSGTVNVPVSLNSVTIDITIVDEDDDTYTIYGKRVRNGGTVTITLDDLDD
ncbi:hypothetical protein FACS1894200_00980 [Spirochaetia bacterium]|nr:hypothetical protein FACS1894200_00980 [Spirochaetia bacterium]